MKSRVLVREDGHLEDGRSERGAIREEGLNKQRGSVWIGRSGGSSVVATPWGDAPGESEASENIDIDR